MSSTLMEDKKAIDLVKIVEKHKLKKGELAKTLFPNNKHSAMALRRILKNEQELSASQVQMLANYVGVNVADLFEPKWSVTSSDGGTTEFIKWNYKAVMNTKTNAISLYVDGARVAEKPFKVDTSIKASAFFALLDEMFANY